MTDTDTTIDPTIRELILVHADAFIALQNNVETILAVAQREIEQAGEAFYREVEASADVEQSMTSYREVLACIDCDTREKLWMLENRLNP